MLIGHSYVVNYNDKYKFALAINTHYVAEMYFHVYIAFLIK